MIDVPGSEYGTLGDPCLPLGSRKPNKLGQWCISSQAVGAGARNIKCGERAVPSTHEAVIHIVPICVVSGNFSLVVDALGEGALAIAGARAWSAKRLDGTVPGAHEAMRYADAGTQPVSPRDLARIIDGGDGWNVSFHRARRVEIRDDAAPTAHERVVLVVPRVNVVADDRPLEVDALEIPPQSVRMVNRRERAVRSTYEAVI